jgi:hypothetical protein
VTALVFLADVFIRRVHVGFGWVVPVVTSAWQAISARRHDPRHEERLERLRSRKAEVGEAIDERRAATRFEPVVEAIAEDKSPDEVLREASLPPVREEPKRPVVGPSGTDTAAGPSYTERLLQAKKKAWQDRGDTPEPPPTRPPEDQGENVL